jgi:hypothetical protein
MANGVRAQESGVELAAYWTFDQGYTSAVNNELFEGIPQGGEFNTITNVESEFVRGSGALKLDSGIQSGDGTYVDVPNRVFPNGHDAVSIVSWYRYEDISGDGSDSVNTVFETSLYPAFSFGLHFEVIFNGDQIRDGEWLVTGLASRQLDNDDGPIVDDGNWHHVAVVWDRAAFLVKFYHDGKLRDVAPTTLIPPLIGTDGFHIGNDAIGFGTRDWDGYIDDVAVFDGVLTSSQVEALYAGEATPLNVHEIPDVPPGGESPEFDPESWTMVIIPDTQKYVLSTHFAPIYTQMMEWVRDHRADRNIAIALHLGDITNDNDDDGGIQWERARESMAVLDGEVPYVLSTGNHDHGPSGNASNRNTRLNDTFQPEQNPLNDPENGGILAGTMESGKLENAYYDFTAPDGRQFLILSLEWGPRQEVVDWAKGIAGLEQYQNHMAVLVTHSYLYSKGVRHDWLVYGTEQKGNPHSYDTAGLPGGVNDGEELWNKLVRVHANFKFTFNGHTATADLGDMRTGVGFLTEAGLAGNLVHQMLFNAQHVGGNGGGGWIRLLEFSPDGRVQVKTFSPYLESIGEDPWRRESFDQFSFLIDDPLGGSDRRMDEDVAVDWLHSPWLGFYNISSFPWIYHYLHGFVYEWPLSTEDEFFLYDPVIGTWIFSNPEIYPNLYFYDGQGWMYFFDQPLNPRWFFRYADAQSVSYNRSE